MGSSESAVTVHLHVDQEFAAHETLNHSAKEYARGDVTTNTVEGFCLIFKRGMRGVYQDCCQVLAGLAKTT